MHVRFPSCNYYQYPEISTIDAKLLPILFSMYFLFFFFFERQKQNNPELYYYPNLAIKLLARVEVYIKNNKIIKKLYSYSENIKVKMNSSLC